MNRLGRKILKSVLSLAIATQTPVAFAAVDSKEVVGDVATQLKRIKGTKASFCFAVENGAVTGYNENDPVRAASVTKTLTTFWAVEALGPNFQYTTHVFYQPSTGEMHIQGARDPFFDRDRVFTLLADLNRKHVTHINRLTVDSNFWFWPDATEFRYFGGGGGGGGHGRARGGKASRGKAAARGKSSAHGKPAFHLKPGAHGKPAVRGKAAAHAKPAARAKAPAKGHAAPHRGRRHAMNEQAEVTGGGRSPASLSPRAAFFEAESHTDHTIAGDMAKVKRYTEVTFNTGGWTQSLKDRYGRSRASNPVLGLPASVEMKTDVVDVVPSNPLAGKPGVYEFVIKSAPIKTYLKQMNIYSINPYAEEMYFSFGGKARFVEFMQKRFGYGGHVANVNTGSGVNMHGGNRNDSMASCATIVKMIRRMDMDLESKYHMDLADLMSVPAYDHGTWIDASKTLIVKTGTLKNPTAAKNLAGVKETKQGEVYFGIFIDKAGGNSGNVNRALTAMSSNFQGVQIAPRSFTFTPVGTYTHMQLIGPGAQQRAN